MPADMMSPRTRAPGWLTGVALGWLGLAAVAAPTWAKSAKPARADQAMELLFETVQPAIRECALSHAIYKGVTVVELQAMMMVARDGSVFSAQVTAKLTPTSPAASASKLQDCVAAALRKMKFAASSETFRKLLRTWKFATQ